MFTKYAIESMGYTEHPESDELEVRFGIIKAYSLQGMAFDNDCERKVSQLASFGNYCVAVVAQSINEASQLLIGDVFADDEQAWISEKNTSPPFLMIHFRESSSRITKGGYRQEREGNIFTFDAFPAKVEIINWEKDDEGRIITALTVHLSTLTTPVKITPIDRVVFGKTPEGKTLYDLKFSSNITIIRSDHKSIDLLATSLKKAEQLFCEISKDTGHHIYAALGEEDPFKQFLGYFFFIERLTHRIYKTINFDRAMKELFGPPDRMAHVSSDFLLSVFSESKNISQRFHWCAMTIWDQLDDQDIEDFILIKRVRDNLAHGEHIPESTLPVEKAKRLSLKLLGTRGARSA